MFHVALGQHISTVQIPQNVSVDYDLEGVRNNQQAVLFSSVLEYTVSTAEIRSGSGVMEL